MEPKPQNRFKLERSGRYGDRIRRNQRSHRDMWPAERREVQQHQLRVLDLRLGDLDCLRCLYRDRGIDQKRRDGLAREDLIRGDEHGRVTWIEWRNGDSRFHLLNPEGRFHLNGICIRCGDGGISQQKRNVVGASAKWAG